jgi:hypothetical protein
MNRLNKHEDHAASKKERHTEIYKHGTSDMAVDDEMMLDVGFDVGLMWKPLETSSGRRGWHSFRSSPLM